MEQLPLDLRAIILDYKRGMEQHERWVRFWNTVFNTLRFSFLREL